MKQLKVFFYIILSAVLMVGIIFTTTGCENGNVKKLKNEVRKLNAVCPVNMGITGDLISVKYSKKDNRVVFYYSLNEQIAGGAFIQKNKNNIRKSVKLMFASDQFDQPLKDILNAQSSVTIVYKIPSTGKSMSISIPYEELKELTSTPLTNSQIKQMRIENSVEISNASCPCKVENGIMMTKVSIEDNYVVYHYSVDENIYDMDELGKNAIDLKIDVDERIKKSCSDQVLRSYLENIADLEYGIKYHYYGTNTDKYITIKILPEELHSMLYVVM